MYEYNVRDIKSLWVSSGCYKGVRCYTGVTEVLSSFYTGVEESQVYDEYLTSLDGELRIW